MGLLDALKGMFGGSKQEESQAEAQPEQPAAEQPGKDTEAPEDMGTQTEEPQGQGMDDSGQEEARQQ